MLFLFVVALAGNPACYDQADSEYARPDRDGSKRKLATRQLEEGRDAYETHCIGCHGPEGDGNGDAAKFLHPKPRNFQLAKFKFTSARSGQLPLDEDLKRTIRQGLKGSAMPGFGQLSDQTVDALVAYMKTFSPKWTDQQVGEPIPIVGNPYSYDQDKSAAIARGEVIYHAYSQCWSCHPAYVSGDQINAYRRQLDSPEFPGFRETLHSAVGKVNAEDQLIYPPDFRRDFVRAGADAETLYRSIAAGISGTAMPTWVDSMDYKSSEGEQLVSTADLWAIAYYVEDLIRQRPAKLEGAVTVRERSEPIYLHGAPPKPEQEPAEQPAEEVVDVDF